MSERNLQISCVTWFRLQYPKIKIWATPNGGSRNVREAVNLKREGVLAGVPDLFIAMPNKEYSGLFVELKYKKGKVSEAQNDMINYLHCAGYCVVVVNEFDKFKEVVTEYLNND